jgi:hypothetical protein
MRLGGSLKLRIFVLRFVNQLCVQESGTDVLRVNFEDTSTPWRPGEEEGSVGASAQPGPQVEACPGFGAALVVPDNPVALAELGPGPSVLLLALVEVALEPARREYLYDPDGPALHRAWGTLRALSTQERAGESDPVVLSNHGVLENKLPDRDLDAIPRCKRELFVGHEAGTRHEEGAGREGEFLTEVFGQLLEGTLHPGGAHLVLVDGLAIAHDARPDKEVPHRVRPAQYDAGPQGATAVVDLGLR